MHLQSAPTIDHVTLIRGCPSHLAYNRLLLFIIWKQGWLWKFVFKILSIKKDDNAELYKIYPHEPYIHMELHLLLVSSHIKPLQ